MKSLSALALLLLAAAPPEPTSLREVSDALVCQCGCGMLLSACNMQNCGSATPMRARIEAEIREGKSKETIVQGFVDQMGLKVLSAPPTEGFNLSAWVMPFVALLLGAVIAQKVLLSWRRRAVAPGAPIQFPSVSDEQRRRIERELKDFET